MAWEILLAGFAGGLVRVLLAARKYHGWCEKAATLSASGIVGALAAAAFFFVTDIPTGMTAALLAAGLAGYVGADVVESLYKIRAARGGRLV